jgi:hypothetical protein
MRVVEEAVEMDGGKLLQFVFLTRRVARRRRRAAVLTGIAAMLVGG